METIDLDNGLTIGLCDYQLNRPLKSSYRNRDAILRFNILFSGSFSITEPDIKTRVKNGELYLSRGPMENMQHTTQGVRHPGDVH